MKKGLLLIIVLALLATTATWAQEEGAQEKTPATETQDTFKMAEYPSDVPYRIGIRGGLNIADMVYTNPAPAMYLYYSSAVRNPGISSESTFPSVRLKPAPIGPL